VQIKSISLDMPDCCSNCTHVEMSTYGEMVCSLDVLAECEYNRVCENHARIKGE